jgi:hypothetical protein
VKYLCLVYHEEKKLDDLPRGEWNALVDESLALREELETSGRGIAAEALQPVDTAMTVRIRNGKASTTDGPFVETKEQLGGFFLIDVGDLNEAIQVASRIPGARVGSVEVRPIRDLVAEVADRRNMAHDTGGIGK